MSRLAIAISLWGATAAQAADQISIGHSGVAVQPVIQSHAGLALPVEEVLRALAARIGVSFVFDSRIMQGKRIVPIDTNDAPEAVLRESLKTANLDIHKISATTYAITPQKVAAIAPAVAAADVAAAPALIDTIVVMATSAAASPEVGARNLFVLDREVLDSLTVINPSEAIFELPQSVASVSAANTSFFWGGGRVEFG